MFRRKSDRNERWPVPVAKRMEAASETRKRKHQAPEPPEQVVEPDRRVEEPAAEVAPRVSGANEVPSDADPTADRDEDLESSEPSPAQDSVLVEAAMHSEDLIPIPVDDPVRVVEDEPPPAGSNGDVIALPGATNGEFEFARAQADEDLRDAVRQLVTSVRTLLDERSGNGAATTQAHAPEGLVSLSHEPSRESPAVDAQPSERVLLGTATAVEDGEEVAAEVTLFWNGKPLIGSGRGHEGRDGALLAAARACVDALMPILNHGLQIEGIYTARASQDRELLMVSIVVGEELLVGSGRILEGEEALSAARAVLDALNRQFPRLVAGAI